MNYSFSEPARSMSLFVLAGLCRLAAAGSSGNGFERQAWLVGTDWWRRVDALRRHPHVQPAHFGRVYGVYGVSFIVLSLLGAGG